MKRSIDKILLKQSKSEQAELPFASFFLYRPVTRSKHVFPSFCVEYEGYKAKHKTYKDVWSIPIACVPMAAATSPTPKSHPCYCRTSLLLAPRGGPSNQRLIGDDGWHYQQHAPTQQRDASFFSLTLAEALLQQPTTRRWKNERVDLPHHNRSRAAIRKEQVAIAVGLLNTSTIWIAHCATYLHMTTCDFIEHSLTWRMCRIRFNF